MTTRRRILQAGFALAGGTVAIASARAGDSDPAAEKPNNHSAAGCSDEIYP